MSNKPEASTRVLQPGQYRYRVVEWFSSPSLHYGEGYRVRLLVQVCGTWLPLRHWTADDPPEPGSEGVAFVTTSPGRQATRINFVRGTRP